MKNPVKGLLSLLVAVSMCLLMPLAAVEAEAAEPTAETPAVTDTSASDTDSDEITVDMTIFDDAELSALVETFIADHASQGVKADNISIAYTYTATGETWFYNPDEWYYSASLYKVPLMMILAQMEANGELTQESDVKGLTLAEAESSILTYSNNDFAHLMLNYLGTDQEAREMYKQFSSQPDDYYDPDFIDYSYFSVRFMNDVMTTLYNEPERFPHIIDCLKVAQPNGYFHLSLDPSIVIAQKYGSYKEFNNTSAIIYTENPVILTVMTENVAHAEQVLGDAAKVFTDYTYTLDAKLDSYAAEKAAAEEAARIEAEEAARIQAEQDAELEEQIKAQREAEELARAEAEKAEQQRIEKEARQAKLIETMKKVGIVATVVVAVALSAVVIVKRHKAAPARRDERNPAPAPRRQNAPRYDEAPRRQSAPRYDEAPRRQSAPRYDEAPRRQSAPRYDEMPRRQSAPRYDEAPRRQSAPRYDDTAARRRERQQETYSNTPARRKGAAESRRSGDDYIPKH